MKLGRDRLRMLAAPTIDGMTDCADHLIASLDLVPHPEGGFYRQIYKSASMVVPEDGRDPRAALTAIYFLLPAGEVSRWYCVRSDEVWTHLEGEPVRLHLFDGGSLRQVVVGPLAEGSEPLQVVPAGAWQAAEPIGSYALVACFVAPGFEFADFTLVSDAPAIGRRLAELGAPLIEE
jgi:predicted cupin superfamily sugar epimerase